MSNGLVQEIVGKIGAPTVLEDGDRQAAAMLVRASRKVLPVMNDLHAAGKRIAPANSKLCSRLERNATDSWRNGCTNRDTMAMLRLIILEHITYADCPTEINSDLLDSTETISQQRPVVSARPTCRQREEGSLNRISPRAIHNACGHRTG